MTRMPANPKALFIANDKDICFPWMFESVDYKYPFFLNKFSMVFA